MIGALFAYLRARPWAALIPFCFAATATADDWPAWLGPQRDGIWREDGILDHFPTGGPKVRWRTPTGSGYAGPAVVGNRVYVTDFTPKAASKAAGMNMSRARLPGVERVLCLNDATGAIVWEHKYDCDYAISFPAGPRTTPLVADGKVYTLGAMGDLLCLDAETGKVVWSVNLAE